MSTKELTHEEYIKSLGLATDDEQALFAVLGKEEVWKKAKGGILRQSDYSRAMDELRTKQADADAAAADAQRYYDELTEWQGKTSAQVEADQKRFEAAEAKAQDLERKLRAAARANGISEDDLSSIPSSKLEEKPPSSTPQFDESKFITLEKARELAQQQVLLQGQLTNLVHEHYKLFPDKELDAEALYKEAITHKKMPMDWWKEKYGVEQVKAERAAELHKAEIEQARKEGYIQGKSEQGVNRISGTRIQPSSALFTTDRTTRPTATTNRRRSGEHIREATQDFYSRIEKVS